MSEIGNSLRMLLIMQNNKWIKIEELAEMLEVDERTIRRYRIELEKAGIYIESRTGKYGGYRLFDNTNYFKTGISDEEYQGLQYINKYLNDINHIYKNHFLSVIEKITAIKNKRYLDNSLDNFDTHVTKECKSNFSRKTELHFLSCIRESIVLNNKIEIEYCSITSGGSIRIVHPYATYQIKGDIYFLAYCENKREFRDFKACRIVKLKIIDEKFDRREINIEDILRNSIGIYKGIEIELKMLVFEPFSQIVKEKIWVPDQKITELEDKSILFEARMEGIPEIKSWILSMGPCVHVLQPIELIEEIKSDIEKIKTMYSDS